MAEYIDRNKIFPNKTFFASAEDPLKSLDELITRIWSIPAADVVEVVHAAWELVRMDENDMPIYRCTNCKTKRYGRTLYCSRCGAKMDGERRDER